MNKKRANIEVYNDLDKRVYTVFKVLQDKEMAKELERRLRATPYAREEWKLAYDEQYPDDPVEVARRTIIRSFMSNGANGACRDGKSGFGLKMKGDERCAQLASWPNYPDMIPLFTERLQGVCLENKDGLKLIEQLDAPETLFYVDPPYMPETWYSGSGYQNTPQADYHKELLDKLKKVQGMVVLSGYDNTLYRNELDGWAIRSKQTLNQHSEPRTEYVWINQAVQRKIASLRPTLMEAV